MKKLLLLFALLIGTSIHCMAQNYTEAVYLKNGSVIRGIITEQVPNKSLKIQTSDGSIFSFAIDEVEKITKELGSPKKRRVNENKAERKASYQSTPKEYQHKRSVASNYKDSSLKGYKGFVETGFIFDLTDNNSNNFNLSTTHGYQFNNYLFVGGGVEMNYYNDADLYALPVFASFRANFMNKKITPFVDIKSGYSAGDVEGVFATLGAGVRFALARKMALNLKIEYAYQEYDNYWDNSESVNGIGLKVGFEF